MHACRLASFISCLHKYENAVIDLCFSFDATHVERLRHVFRSCIKSSALKGELSQGMSCIPRSCVFDAGFDVYSLCRAADVCAHFSGDVVHRGLECQYNQIVKFSYPVGN